MLNHAHSPLITSASASNGIDTDNKLIPLALIAVSSLSALNLPNNKSIAVKSANGRTHAMIQGNKSPIACTITNGEACRLISNVSTSRSTFAVNKMNAKTHTVITSVVIAWRKT